MFSLCSDLYLVRVNIRHSGKQISPIYADEMIGLCSIGMINTHLKDECLNVICRAMLSGNINIVGLIWTDYWSHFVYLVLNSVFNGKKTCLPYSKLPLLKQSIFIEKTTYIVIIKEVVKHFHHK